VFSTYAVLCLIAIDYLQKYQNLKIQQRAQR